MSWKYSKERVGICAEGDRDVLPVDDPLRAHIDKCGYYEQGKPSHD